MFLRNEDDQVIVIVKAENPVELAGCHAFFLPAQDASWMDFLIITRF